MAYLCIMNWHYRYALILTLLLAMLSSCVARVPILACPISANSTASCDPQTPGSVSTNTTQTLFASSNSTSGFSLSDLVPRITVQELWQKVNSNADILIIDTRVGVETLYSSGHIKGAIPVPLSQFTEKAWMPSVALDKEIILY
jgi:hypothetical protein